MCGSHRVYDFGYVCIHCFTAQKNAEYAEQSRVADEKATRARAAREAIANVTRDLRAAGVRTKHFKTNRRQWMGSVSGWLRQPPTGHVEAWNTGITYQTTDRHGYAETESTSTHQVWLTTEGELGEGGSYSFSAWQDDARYAEYGVRTAESLRRKHNL